MTVKAGQKCTAIRKAIVPRRALTTCIAALRAALGKIVVGDPRLENVRMGPVASLSQRREVLEQLGAAQARSGSARGRGRRRSQLVGADARSRRLREPDAACIAVTRARHGDPCGGGLRPGLHAHALRDVERCHRAGTPRRRQSRGFHFQRRRCGRRAAGAGTRAVPRAHRGGEPLLREGIHRPRLTAAAPGPRRTGACRRGRGNGRHPRRHALHAAHRRAGHTGCHHRGDRALGARQRASSIRACIRSASPSARSPSAIRSTPRSARSRSRTSSASRRYPAITSTRIWMRAQAARNPLFGGRVAHGYFLVSAAAGLFVDPPYGPVLANYGLDSLRFLKPVKPGDRIKVRLTCKEKVAAARARLWRGALGYRDHQPGRRGGRQLRRAHDGERESGSGRAESRRRGRAEGVPAHGYRLHERPYRLPGVQTQRRERGARDAREHDRSTDVHADQHRVLDVG